MDTLPVIQNFFGKPVRFFKAEFKMEIRGHHAPQSPEKITIETWGVPFPDFCRSIEKSEKDIRRMINLSDDVFRPFYRIEHIPDALGRQRTTILMAYEMCMLLAARLNTSKIKDADLKEKIVQFQQWIMIVFHMIRRGKLRPVRMYRGAESPPDYLSILSLPSGRETRKAVIELARKESVTEQQIYRRFQKLTGENMRTRKGNPKQSPSTAGNYRKRPEYQQVLGYRKDHPKAMGAEIRRALDLGVSAGRINFWIKATHIH